MEKSDDVQVGMGKVEVAGMDTENLFFVFGDEKLGRRARCKRGSEGVKCTVTPLWPDSTRNSCCCSVFYRNILGVTRVRGKCRVPSCRIDVMQTTDLFCL